MATNWQVHSMLSFLCFVVCVWFFLKFINLFLFGIPQLSLCILPIILLLSFLKLATERGSHNIRKSRRRLFTVKLAF